MLTLIIVFSIFCIIFGQRGGRIPTFVIPRVSTTNFNYVRTPHSDFFTGGAYGAGDRIPTPTKWDTTPKFNTGINFEPHHPFSNPIRTPFASSWEPTKFDMPKYEAPSWTPHVYEPLKKWEPLYTPSTLDPSLL